jgi:DNA-binding response OmpR family regulator
MSREILDFEPTPVVVVDKDKKFTTGLRNHLNQYNYSVWGVSNPDKGKELAADINPRFVLLNEGMPFSLESDFLQSERVVILEEEDAVKAANYLDAGAEQVLAKPVNPRYLEAVLKSMQRTIPDLAYREERRRNTLESGDLTVDINGMLVTRRGGVLDVQTLDYELLLYFMENKGIVLSRQDILEYLRSKGSTMDNAEFVRAYVGKLREKIDGDDEPSHIKTIRGYGYQFMGDTRVSDKQ